jgi:hypothetical protein
MLARRKLNQGGGATRASTNADSYAWLANSKYFFQLTGYFPLPDNHKEQDNVQTAVQQALDQTKFTLNLGTITRDTTDAEIEDRKNGNLRGYETKQPGKEKSLSIAMMSTIYAHVGHAEVHSEWKFYSVTAGQAVGPCGQTDGKEIIPQWPSVVVVPSPAGDDPENPPWPTGEFKLTVEGLDCTYKNDGKSPGRLFCGGRQIACKEDDAKSKKDGVKKCNRDYFHAVVYCDF